MGVKKGCRDNFVMPTLSMTVIRGSYVAATTTMVPMRVRSTSTTTTVTLTLTTPPAQSFLGSALWTDEVSLALSGQLIN